MKKQILIITLFHLVVLTGFTQQAQVGENGRTLLVWPFENSFFIDQNTGSHAWSMICGPGCGLHKNSDQNALDWSRRYLTACGSVFYAPLSGTVIHVTSSSNSGYGNQLVIQSDQNSNYAFRMAHMQEVWVNAGDYVETGEPLGRVGDTGNGGCHGHLAVYRNIYDQAELVFGPIDTTRSYQQAIDYLRRGQFVPTPYDNQAYFSEPFSFVYGQEGIGIEVFGVDDRHIAIEDSVRARVKVRNLGKQEWEGALALAIREGPEFTYSTFLDHLGMTDTFSLSAGASMEFRLSFPVGNYSPGYYYIYLLYVVDVLSLDNQLPMELPSPLRSAEIQLLEREKCNLDEPNDDEHTATPLFIQVLTEATELKERKDFISVFEDEKDVYTFQTERPGLMKINFTDSLRFSMNVFTSSGSVPLTRRAGTLSFITKPGTTYFIELTGERPSCEHPYSFEYAWKPVETVAWELTVNKQLFSKLIVLEAAQLDWQIFDLMGRRLFSSGKKLLESGEYFNSNTFNAPPGIYLAALFVEGRLVEQKKFFWHP